MAVLVLALGLGGCTPTGLAVGAAATVGTAAAREKGLDGSWNDGVIRLRIQELWLESDPGLFAKLGLTVEEGKALLTGKVADPETRVEAVRLAWRAPGVREVINEIEIDEPVGFGGFARDSWIIARLRSKLLLDRAVNSINFSIDAVDRVVYVMGIARDRAELERVIGHAKDIAYVRRVVDYVRILQPPDLEPGPEPGPDSRGAQAVGARGAQSGS